MLSGRRHLIACSIILCACGGSSAAASSASTTAPAPAPAAPSASAAASARVDPNAQAPSATPPPPDRRADCALVQSELAIDAESKGRGIDVANVLPESPEDRNRRLAAIDRYLAKWKDLTPRIGSGEVRDAGAAYIAALEKHRAVIASLRFEAPPPDRPKPVPTPAPKKPLTNAEIAKRAALADAAEYGMIGKLRSMGPYLREEDRRAFDESRGRFLDAWQPLALMCEQ
jgi:hypothetical protein